MHKPLTVITTPGREPRLFAGTATPYEARQGDMWELRDERLIMVLEVDDAGGITKVTQVKGTGRWNAPKWTLNPVLTADDLDGAILRHRDGEWRWDGL